MMTDRLEPEPPPKNATDTAWNELQFLSWTEFQQMAPSIVQLEITRLGKLIPSSLKKADEQTEFHNTIVRARFALQQFVACLATASKDTLDERCAGHLRTAIMTLSFPVKTANASQRDECRYVLNRLNHVYDRIFLIY